MYSKFSYNNISEYFNTIEDWLSKITSIDKAVCFHVPKGFLNHHPYTPYTCTCGKNTHTVLCSEKVYKYEQIFKDNYNFKKFKITLYDMMVL